MIIYGDNFDQHLYDYQVYMYLDATSGYKFGYLIYLNENR